MFNVLDNIGFFGPILLVLISISQLWNQRPYLIGYLVFLFGNTTVNKLLKMSIKQARPSDGRSIINEDYVGADKFGMPSAHAQSAFFSITYLYLTKDTSYWLLIGIFISALTLYQRWSYRRHTAEQLWVGAAVGGCVAYAGVFLTKKWLTTRNF